MTETVESREFQAETKALLALVTHSLYTDSEIFLRELISNASDALDRLRFESLTNSEMLEGDDRFEILLEIDKEGRKVTVSDSGIGMSREEAIANLGTIAKSGTGELRELLGGKGSAAHAAELIGRFGVGFYSSFMVADRVTVRTRRAGTIGGIEWESDGGGSYSIRDYEKTQRGTSITLHLKPADPENGMPDFADRWRISSIVKKHSDYITYPILLKPETKPGEEKTQEAPLNSMKPLWKRPASEVKPEEYAEFYRHISNDMSEPLRTIHFRAEGTFEYEALLYVPSTAPLDLYYVGAERGLRLFSKRVMIMERCEDLIPPYLRFIQGVVDASDLPLNISRQRLQQDHHITRIRKRITTKVLDLLTELFENDRETYLKLWAEFGRAIKEGASDWENKDRIVPLLLYASSNDPEKLTSFKEYVSRMKPEQEQIFYLTGESRGVIENSPHLEAVRQKGYEVLYMSEPVDELVLQYLNEFESKKLKSVGKGAIELGTEDEKKEAQKELEGKQEEFKPLTEFLQKTLGESIKEVRLSARLTTSPACLVVGEHEFSPMLERALRSQGAPKTKRVLEINPNHALIQRMRERLSGNAEDAFLPDAAEVLLGLSQLAEGSELSDPVKFNRSASEVLSKAI
ncbi:MAG TPA: molecular chaperone HtpG [Bryobacteraceae bacterium]|jgi:molecular chaperone HtpG|nr:molecular chaperone HtpG [Bryobacteraceae bacterium]